MSPNTHQKFEELFEQHWAMLYEVAYQKIGAEAEAKDVVQELFIHLWRTGAWEGVNGDIKFYLLRALRNRLLNYFRDKGVHNRHVELFGQLNDALSVDALAALTSAELHELIDAEIAKLPSKMREIFLLSREEGLTIDQIASKLNIAPQTVKNQISETLKRLRHGLRHYPLAIFLLALQ